MSFSNFTQIASKDFNEGICQIRVGDFNGDSHIDFVVARINADLGTTPVPLQFFVGSRNGQFRDATIELFGFEPMVHFVPRMIVTDFNNDGVSDLFCIDNGIDKPPFTGGQNELYLSQNGQLIDSTKLLPQELKNNHGASVGDINRDGLTDIVVNALMSDGNQLLMNTGSRFLSMPSILPALQVKSPFGPYLTTQTNTYSGLIDVNLDGYLDLILGNWDAWNSPKNTEVFFNKNGSFASSNAISIPNSGIENQIVLDVKAIDLNGDKLPDLAFSITNGGDQNDFYRTPYLQLLINKGDGVFIDETSSRFSQDKQKQKDTSWYLSIEITDLNRDSFMDMVLVKNGAGASKVLINDGTGHFISAFEIPQWERVAIGDVNNDGMDDIIVSNASSVDSFATYINNFKNSHQYIARFGGDKLKGSATSDTFYSSSSNDIFIGNGGLDYLKYLNSSSKDFTLVKNTSDWISTGIISGEIDTLVDISRVKFSDKVVALDINGNAGQAYRLYQAALDRTPDERGLAGWIKFMDEGGALTNMAQQFIDSQEFRTKYGALDNRNFVNQLYLNVLDRNGESAGITGWVNGLANGLTRADVLKGFSESSENQANVIGQIKNGIPYTEWWLS